MNKIIKTKTMTISNFNTAVDTEQKLNVNDLPRIVMMMNRIVIMIKIDVPI